MDGYFNCIYLFDLNGGDYRVLVIDSDVFFNECCYLRKIFLLYGMELIVSFLYFINNIMYFFCKCIEEKVVKVELIFYKIYFYVFYYRWIIKMDKLMGLKVFFMLEYLEFGWLDNLDVYIDEIFDDKILFYL